MTVALSPDQRQKLAKLLGMLGSNHSGERDAAGLAANRFVQQAGLTWFDVLDPPAQPARRVAPSWRLTIQECLRLPCALSAWELEFLHDIARRRRLSERQEAALQRIAERVLTQPGRRPGGGRT